MLERDVVVGHVRRSGWERVAFGVHRRTSMAGEWPDLAALARVLPPTGCYTHLTAAAIWGAWLPPVPDGLPVIVSQQSADPRPKRPGLKIMRHTRPIEQTVVERLPVARPAEVILACARDLALLDLVVIGDSLLHRGLTTLDQLQRSGTRNRWGAAAHNRALSWLDARSESPWESLLRVFHRTVGVEVVPQHEVRRADGTFVARGDLWLRGTRVLHEYDGAVHREASVHRRDLARDRDLLGEGWSRRGYTAVELIGRPEQILADADASLGRRHNVARLDTWLRMVEESTFSVTGRAALAARLGCSTSGSGPSLHQDAG